MMFVKVFANTPSMTAFCKICRSCGENSFFLLKQFDIQYAAEYDKRWISTVNATFRQKVGEKSSAEVQVKKEKKSNKTKEIKLKDQDVKLRPRPSEIDKKEQLIEMRRKFLEKQLSENKKEKEEESDDKFYQYDDDTGKKEQTDREKDENQSRFLKDTVLQVFHDSKTKNRDTFLECLRMYESQPGKKRERVPFIYAALKLMEEFGVHKDLTVYKKLIDIFPKQTMIPTNVFQTMYNHYPREQFCCTALLEQMEDNGVIPDSETELMLLNIFGSHGTPVEKYWKMMYWMPKFKNLNPWPVPNPIPDDALELAKLAMHKISSVDVESKISVFDTEDIQDSVDKTWIVSAMAQQQQELLKKHDKKTAIYVEGPFRIYVATKSVDYFTLRANSIKDRKYPDLNFDGVNKIRNPYLEAQSVDVILPPCIHEQIDGTIFANCATGMSTKDSLLSWIRFLQKENPVLGDIAIVFTLKNYAEERYFIEQGTTEKKVLSAGDENSDKLLQ